MPVESQRCWVEIQGGLEPAARFVALCSFPAMPKARCVFSMIELVG